MAEAADLIEACAIATLAGTVLIAYHLTPTANEALFYYREYDKRAFVAMRTCYVVIATAMAFNARYLISWALRRAWAASTASTA